MTAMPKILSRAEEDAAARAKLKGCGYAAGGRLRQEENRPAHKDARMMKRRAGGEVPGDKPEPRADKRARGGALKHHAPTVQIVLPGAAEGEKKQAAAAGMQAGARMGAQAAAAKMGPPGAGGPPPGAMPPPGGQPPMRRGGKVK